MDVTSFTFDFHMLRQERVKAALNSDNLAPHASRVCYRFRMSETNLNAFKFEIQGHDEETRRGTL